MADYRLGLDLYPPAWVEESGNHHHGGRRTDLGSAVPRQSAVPRGTIHSWG
jgi:hypothetical protein